MISGMEEGIVFADADNVIVEINDFMCRFMGGHRRDILGKPVRSNDLEQVIERYRPVRLPENDAVVAVVLKEPVVENSVAEEPFI